MASKHASRVAVLALAISGSACHFRPIPNVVHVPLVSSEGDPLEAPDSILVALGPSIFDDTPAGSFAAISGSLASFATIGLHEKLQSPDPSRLAPAQLTCTTSSCAVTLEPETTHTIDFVLASGKRVRGYLSSPSDRTALGLVLLVHGMLDDAHASYVRAIEDEELRHGYGTLALDLADHGITRVLSPRPLCLGLEPDVGEIARRMKNALGLEVGAVGFSLGALVVLNAAHQAGNDDTFSLGVVVMSPALDPGDAIEALDDAWSITPRGSSAALFKDLLHRRPEHLNLQRIHDYVERAAAPCGYENADAVLHAATAFAAAADGGFLRAGSPTRLLVFFAEDDVVIDSRVAKALSDENPRNVTVVMTPFGGHCGFDVAYPITYRAAVRRWLSQGRKTVR